MSERENLIRLIGQATGRIPESFQRQ